MNSPWTELPVPPARAPHRGVGFLPQALALMFLRRPGGAVLPAPLPLFAGVAALLLAGGLLVDDLMVSAPRESNPWAVTERSFPILLALALSTLVCFVLRRPQLVTRLASTALLACTPLLWAWPWLSAEWPASFWLSALPWLYAALLSLQSVRWLQADAALPRRATAVLLSAGLLGAAFQWIPYSSWWWSEYADEEAYDEAAYAPATLPISAESLWNLQPQRLQEALRALAPQRPGQIDLYALGLAGDGSEDVFRNEVDYFATLVEQRLQSPGRVLRLINHPDAVEQAPLASLTNLRQALQAIGQRMDVDEDLLLLFLTSHGSDDHQFYLGLDPLPLDPIEPDTLREALDSAGIRWRVLVVSSCYSGGFVDALRGPETLVITAARADRASFGCGTQSDITWFGEAFLSEALNETIDFSEAFRRAKQRIREREREQGETPSYPQIARGEAIGAKLAQWRSGFAPGEPVPFQPTIER